MSLSRFPTRRGRPALARPTTDLGTPELILKRAYGETIEAIDLCLERGIITTAQHRSGLRLRWLYTLRYGAPFPSARDLSGFHAGSRASDDPDWRLERETEFAQAMESLRIRGLHKPVSHCCIDNIRPNCIDRNWLHAAFDDPALATRLERQREALTGGLELLHILWRKSVDKV